MAEGSTGAARLEAPTTERFPPGAANTDPDANLKPDPNSKPDPDA